MSDLQNIRRVIRTFGNFSVSDLEHAESPMINSLSKDHIQLAERFYSDGVTATIYVQNIDVSSEFIYYEDLPDAVILEISRLADDYEADCLRTEKRIS